MSVYRTIGPLVKSLPQFVNFSCKLYWVFIDGVDGLDLSDNLI